MINEYDFLYFHCVLCRLTLKLQRTTEIVRYMFTAQRLTDNNELSRFMF